MRFGSETTKILLVDYGKYPLGSPLTMILSIWERMGYNVLPDPASSAYKDFE